MTASIRLADLPPDVRKATKAARRDAAYLERERFLHWCRLARLPEPVPEFRFHATRKWRFDFAWPNEPCGPVALEVEGGVFSRGRHTRGAGFVGDLEKYSEAACHGWRIVRIVPEDLYSGRLLDLLRRALAA